MICSPATTIQQLFFFRNYRATSNGRDNETNEDETYPSDVRPIHKAHPTLEIEEWFSSPLNPKINSA